MSAPTFVSMVVFFSSFSLWFLKCLFRFQLAFNFIHCICRKSVSGFLGFSYVSPLACLSKTQYSHFSLWLGHWRLWHLIVQ